VELIGTSPVQITLTQKAIILVRVQPSHRREQLRPINLRCLVPSRLNRHRPENRRPEAAIVTRRARLTGRSLSVSGERKSAFQVARIRVQANPYAAIAAILTKMISRRTLPNAGRHRS
jgi:hypothetical protein